MTTYIRYATSVANVKITYAKAHLAELMARAAQGERIMISRYGMPMAELVPTPKVSLSRNQRLTFFDRLQGSETRYKFRCDAVFT
jgi:prevent-host-death family protein